MEKPWNSSTTALGNGPWHTPGRLPLYFLLMGCAAAALADSFPSRAVPALSPTVSGQIQAQSVLTQSFSDAQIGNLSSHLQRLHQGLDPCTSSKVAVSAPASAARRNNTGDGLARQTRELHSAAQPSVTSKSSAVPSAPKCLNDLLFASGQSALWSAGTVNFGPNARSTTARFTSPGLTFGVDHQLAQRLIVGAAVGRGWNDATVGNKVSGMTGATSTNGTLYMHYQPAPTTTVNALVGYGGASVDNHRWADDRSQVRGSRRGAGWFGSFAVNSTFQKSGVRFEPYLRSDFVASTLDPYNEIGDTAVALGYGASYSNINTLGAGAVALRDITIAGSTLTPVFALRYRRTQNDLQSSNLFYSDAGFSAAYSLAGAATQQTVTTRQFGLRYRSRRGLQSELGANYSSADSSLSRSYMASLHAAF